MRWIKLGFQTGIVLVLGFMYLWAYGGMSAHRDDRPADPETTKEIEQLLEPQKMDDWNRDGDDAPKVAEVNSSEEEAELEENY
jgi:hypothetical protein